MNWSDIQEKLIEKKAHQKSLSSDIDKTQEQIEDLEVALEDLGECRMLIQHAAQETQNLLKTDVENIVTSALSIIPFKNQYEFLVEFVPRRNTTECDLLFTRNGQSMKPLDSSGYGAADIASFAVRIAYWKLSGELRNTMIIDEPFSNLDKEKHEYAAEMVARISEEFTIQFIISSHEPSLINCADKIFTVKQKKGVSYVIE